MSSGMDRFMHHLKSYNIPHSPAPGGTGLCVHASLILARSGIVDLPPSLHVQGCLDLRGTAIAVLPAGLRVDKDLCLWNTPIRRLPPDLCVGALIYPPSCLDDITAFMDQEAALRVALGAGTSLHHRLEMRQRLAPYPDLWTVVQSMKDGQHLHMERTRYDISLWFDTRP